MPTFHLHLRNVPPAAGSKDIRQFFSKFDIPGGGVQIVGGLEGNAFVTFTNYEHLLEATSYDQKTFMGNKLSVCLVNGDDIKLVVQNMMLDLGVHRELPGTSRSIEYPSAAAKSSSQIAERPSATQRSARITEFPSDNQRNSQKTELPSTMETPKAPKTPPMKESRSSSKPDVEPERRRAATRPWESEPDRDYGEGEAKRMRLSSQGEDDNRYGYDRDRPAESYSRDQAADPYSRDRPADGYSRERPANPYNRDRPADPYNRDGPADPYTRDRPADPHNRDRPADPYNRVKPADPHNRDWPAEPYGRDRPADPYNRDRPADPYNRDRPADPHKGDWPADPRNRDGHADPYNRDRPADPYNRDRPADPYTRHRPDPYNRDRIADSYNIDRTAATHDRDMLADQERMQKELEIEERIAQDIADQLQKKKDRIESIKRGIMGEPNLPQITAPRADDERRPREPYARRPIQGEGEAYHRPTDEPRYGPVEARRHPNDGYDDQGARNPGPDGYYEDQRPRVQNEGYGEGDYNYSDPNASYPAEHGQYEDPGYDGRGHDYGHEAARHPSPPHDDPMYSGPYQPSGPEHYPPRGPGPYPPRDPGPFPPRSAGPFPSRGPGPHPPRGPGPHLPRGPGPHLPRGPGPHPPRGPGPHTPRGPGPHPPRGPGPHPPRGPGPHPPRGPGPHTPRGPGPHPPRGPGPHPPRGPGPHPPRGPGPHTPRGPGPHPPRGPGPHLPRGPGPHPPRGPAPIPNRPSYYGGPHGGGEHQPGGGKQGQKTPFYIKMTNIDRFVVPKQIEWFFAGYQICPGGIITKKGGHQGTLIAYIKFANLEEARTCHKNEGRLLGGQQVRIEVIPESVYEAMREDKPVASSGTAVKKTQIVTREHKPVASSVPAAKKAQTVTPEENPVALSAVAAKKTQRVTPEVRKTNIAEAPANRQKQPPPQEYTGSVKRALFYIIMRGVESATATSVWEQFGGPAGRSIGVLLLDKMVDPPDRMAFVAYEKLDHRNEEFGSHTNVSSWTDMGVYATCGQSLPQGKLYQTSPAGDVEISEDSKDLFLQKFFGKEARKVKKTDQQKEAEQLILNKISKSLFPAIGMAVEHYTYLRLGALPLDTTACQVWSWFGGASGPAVHVTLTANQQEDEKIAYVAFRDNRIRNEEFKKYPGSHTMGEARALRSLARASSHFNAEIYKSTITGTDEPMSEEEKAALRANWTSKEDLSVLVDDDVYILMIPGITQNTSACKVWVWFDREKGPVKQVITMDQDKSCTAFVKFRTPTSCNTALKKYKSAEIVSTEEMMRMLASCHVDRHIHYSSPLGQHRLALRERDALVARVSAGENTAGIEEGFEYGENAADTTEFLPYDENITYENPWYM